MIAIKRNNWALTSTRSCNYFEEPGHVTVYKPVVSVIDTVANTGLLCSTQILVN